MQQGVFGKRLAETCHMSETSTGTARQHPRHDFSSTFVTGLEGPVSSSHRLVSQSVSHRSHETCRHVIMGPFGCRVYFNLDSKSQAERSSYMAIARTNPHRPFVNEKDNGHRLHVRVFFHLRHVRAPQFSFVKKGSCHRLFAEMRNSIS
jgi:hypothetical protein